MVLYLKVRGHRAIAVYNVESVEGSLPLGVGSFFEVKADGPKLRSIASGMARTAHA